MLLSLSYQPTRDLTFTLERPGVMDTLIFKVGGNGQNFTGTTLDDAASPSIQNGTVPFNGLFRPSRPKSYCRLNSDIFRGNFTSLQTINRM